MAANAFYGFFTGAPPEVEPGEIVEVSARGSRAYVALWLLLYGVCGLLVLREAWRRGLEIRLVAMIPFALFVIASATWSYNPWSSVVFCVMLTLNIVVAAALAAQVHPRELMALLALTVTVLVAMSLVLLVVDPASAVSTPDRPGIFIPGELYGVFSHKVSLGTYAAIALLVLLFSPEDFPGPLTRWGSGRSGAAPRCPRRRWRSPMRPAIAPSSRACAARSSPAEASRPTCRGTTSSRPGRSTP
jgi:hypothetical protein